jgi:DNA-binding transcriptional regulator LsrR (DeoR family)
MDDHEAGLAVRAAWLYYVHGLTQAEAGDQLGVSRVKVHRLIALAHRQNSVKVFVEGTAAECGTLEQRLKSAYGLQFASVVPSASQVPVAGPSILIKSLGIAAALHLHQHLERRATSVIGLGHGRSLAAVADSLPRVPRPRARFVSVLGCLARQSSANPFDVICRFADRTGAAAYFMPAPVVVDSAESARMIRSERMVKDVLERARNTDLVLVGIGNVRSTPAIYNRVERAELAALGVVAELLGQFLDRDGALLHCDMADRSISMRLDELRGRAVIGVAGGADKASAIGATLKSGLLTGLVTDEDAARRILAMDAISARRRPSAKVVARAA